MALQVWLPLNGDLHNQGLSNIVISNNGASINTSGKIGSCYSFNGSNSYIRSNSTCLSNNNTEWSYTCWFYPINAHNGCLFSNRTSADSRGIAIFYYTSKFLIDDGTRWEFTPSVAISVGAWNHLAIVRKAGSYKKFYLNGQLINSTTTTGTPTLANNSWFSIGTSQNSATTATTNPLNGRLNDVRIYNHALSAKEVEEISKGLILHYPLDNGGNQPNMVLTTHYQNTPWKSAIKSWQYYEGKYSVLVNPATLYNNTGKGTSAIFPGQIFKENTQYTISLDTRDDYRTDGKGTGFRIGFYYTDETGQNYNMGSPQTWEHKVYTSAAGKTVSYIRCSYGNSGYTYIANLKVEEGTIETNFTFNNQAIIYDSSGYNNNGEIINELTYTFDVPKNKLATIFANGAYIKKSDMNFTNNYWTISCWFKKTSSVTSAYETMLGLTKENGADANKKFSLYIYNNKIGCVGEKTSNANITTFDTSKWHHACLVNNNGSFTYYMDGINIKTFSNTNCQTDCTDFVVGGRAAEEDAITIGTPWGGNLCDIRLYATALSVEDILNLYKTSKIINGTNKVPRDLE